MVVSPDEAALVSLAQEFMQEIKDFTPGKKLEAKLNKDYGPHNKYYQGVGCPLLWLWVPPDGQNPGNL